MHRNESPLKSAVGIVLKGCVIDFFLPGVPVIATILTMFPKHSDRQTDKQTDQASRQTDLYRDGRTEARLTSMA